MSATADKAAAFIAIDLGSSNGRVMLGTISAGECLLERVHGWPNVPVRRPELSWNVDELFEETLTGIAAAVDKARGSGIPILGIGVSCWGVDYARVGPDGTLHGPVRHHRAADHSMPTRSAALVPRDEAWAISGVLDQAINTAHQLRSDAELGRVSSEQTAILLPDYWVYRLTGTVAAERTIASTTGLLDRSSGSWSPRLCRDWGIDVQLPPLVDDGQPAGLTTAAITERIGAASALPMYYVAGHDTASAFLTVPPRGDDAVTGVVSAGSWAVTGIETDSAVLSGAAELGFTNELGAFGRNLLVRNLSGMWLVQECLRSWREERGTAPDIAELAAAAETAEHPSVIDVSDPELQKPGHLPERIADRCEERGDRRPASDAEILRVIVQSLAAAYRDTLEAAARITGKRVERIRIIGGGSRNSLLCRQTAELTGLPVDAGPAEATSLGIVVRLAVASGFLADMAEARALRLVDEPDMQFLPPSPQEARP